RCLIDGFGVILAGATVHGSAIVREHVKASASRAESTLLGPERMSATAAQAALANAASGHAMDYDDTQLSTTPDRVFGLLTHPTVPALSASLAVGERLGVSGRVFLEAFLTGFEVECKIAEAINPSHYQRGFHSTGTIGTFGATASVAKLLKLSPAATAHALGIAASMSSGIRVNFGSMTKPLHAARRHDLRSRHRSPRLRQDAQPRPGRSGRRPPAGAAVGRTLSRRTGPSVHARGAAREVHRLREPRAPAGAHPPRARADRVARA